jgi:hypothetical protein
MKNLDDPVQDLLKALGKAHIAAQPVVKPFEHTHDLDPAIDKLKPTPYEARIDTPPSHVIPPKMLEGLIQEVHPPPVFVRRHNRKKK